MIPYKPAWKPQENDMVCWRTWLEICY